MSKRPRPASTAPLQGASAISLELLLSNLPGAVYRCCNDAQWTMEFISDGIEELTGFAPDAFRPPSQLTYSSIIHPEDRAEVASQIETAIRQSRPFQVTYRITTAAGKTKWVWEQGSAVRDEKNLVVALEGFIADFTRVKAAEAKSREHAWLLDKASDAIFIMNMRSTVTYWNKGAERLFGWPASRAVGMRYDELFKASEAQYRLAHDAALEDGEWVGEISQPTQAGTLVETETRWTLVRPEKKSARTAAKFVVISTDISARKNAEARVLRMAFFDPLTELPNRAKLLDHLRRVLHSSTRSKKIGAVMFCDLDNFKSLNDRKGHAAGDAFLQAVARRLERSVRATDLVARLGGDEFVIVLYPEDATFVEAALHAETVAQAILAIMAAPVNLAHEAESVSASIGITLFCGSQESTDSVLTKADAAMYQAKSAGRNTYRFFDPLLQKSVAAQANLQLALRNALSSQEFVLFYQPQLTNDGILFGAEALIRWRTVDNRIILPGEFIKAAEVSGQIIEIGHWVMLTACEQLAKWSSNPATAAFSMSVNISALQFMDRDFVSDTEAIFLRTGADPCNLKFELTESLLVTDVLTTADKMAYLKSLGVMFSLDDFGTGYSSLAYLRKLPLDQLKIDCTFMRDVLTNQNDASIVRSIIALGESLGLDVLAEGVETERQRDFLCEAGCFSYQGFLFSRPLDSDQFYDFATSLQGAAHPPM